MGKFNIHDWQAKQRQKRLNEQMNLPFPDMAFTGTGTFDPFSAGGQGANPGSDSGFIDPNINPYGDQDIFQIGGDFGDPSGGAATFNPGTEIIYPSGWNPTPWFNGTINDAFDIDPTEHLSPLHYIAARYNIIYPKFTPATKGPKWLNMLAFKIYSFYFLLNHPEVIEISQDDYDAASSFNIGDEIDALNELKHLNPKFQMQRQELIPEFQAEITKAMAKKPTQDMMKRVGPPQKAIILGSNQRITAAAKQYKNRI